MKIKKHSEGIPRKQGDPICVNPDCGAVDEMEEYRFADRTARLFSYTSDSLAFSVSPPGYTIITMSVLSFRLGANSRLVGIFMAAIGTGVMFFGGPLIALFPKPVLGGVLTFLGLIFLADWLYDGWRRLSRADYLIVVCILLVMSGFGLLPGLGVGIALAAGLFIVQYSRVPVVRHALSGAQLPQPGGAS